MRPGLLDELPLICPSCRTRGEHGWELFTVAIAEVLDGSADDIRSGVLRCSNAACARRYPIIDGIPILLPHLGEWLRSELAAVVEADLPPAIEGLLAEAESDGEPFPRLIEHLSIYADAHHGDRAEPPPDGPGGGFGFSALAERLSSRATSPVDRAIELGCGLGRGLHELARGARFTVGVDLNFGALRRARRVLAGEPLRYARRAAGRSYLPARVPPQPATEGVALVCGDALDPPFAPGGFDRVVALNLLDAVRTPATLLAVLDGLCAPGGEVIAASPYAWQSGIVDEGARLGTTDPAARVRTIFTTGEGLSSPFTVEEERPLRWWLRRDARSAVTYDVHYLRCRKANG